MKKVTLMMLAACGLIAGTTSCKKEGCTDPEALNYDADVKEKNDDGSCVYDYEPVDTVYVNSNITSSTTWTTGKTYVLTTRVAVESGATLTIEPGVIVKGEAGTGANATALIIAQGGMLMADGTATEPIIFTSIADEIVPGQIASPNLPTDLDGLWGGVIVLGKATISADAASQQIEGIPASDPQGLYGGSDDADNSGSISYISIRHGGANIGEGNEINGLTLGGVGTGTSISNVEVIANQDDGVEFFGGTVNASNVIVWNNGDDAIDTDQSWGGTLDNVVIINPGDEAFELDGAEGAMERAHTITNAHISVDGASGLVDLDDNTICNLSNFYFFNLEEGSGGNGVDFDLNPAGLTCSNMEIDLPGADVLTDYFTDGSDAYATDVTTNTVGATISAFSGWSWAAIDGAMSGW